MKQQRPGLVQSRGLSDEARKDIRELAELCERHDGISLKLNWDMLNNREPGETNDFLYYEKGTLLGFLGIYALQPGIAEASGMVHPDRRRQGLFGYLVHEAEKECRSREITRMLFICANDSVSGKSFLEQANAEYEHSEFVMRQELPTAASLPELISGLHIRESNSEDDSTLIRLSMEGFGSSEEEARYYLGWSRGNPADHTYVAELDGTPIGRIGVMHNEDGGFIYGFCLPPEWRRQGYGRRILADAVRRLQAEGKRYVKLEVAVENPNALRLYESCGFKLIARQDYFAHNIAEQG